MGLDAEEFLEHHGVKGMKWGVRKSGPTGSHTQTHQDFLESRQLKSKGAHALSTKELEAVNKRLGMERKFSELNPGLIKRGDNHVKAVLAVAGTAVAVHKLYTSKEGQAAIRAAKRFMNPTPTFAIESVGKSFI